MPHRARIVDQRRDATQFSVNAVDQCYYFKLDAHIGAHRNGLGAERADLFENAVSGFFIRLEIDANAIALASGQQCRRSANPTTAPGDDEDFVHAYSLLNQPNV